MARLRRAGARRGLVRQRVAVEHNDLFEMGPTAFATARPPIPAPTTTACFKIGFDTLGLPMIAMSAMKISDRLRGRANGQHGDRAQLRKNFRNWVFGYVCNAAVAPSIRDDGYNPASCFGKEGRRRIEQAQKGPSEPGFSRSNSHPIPGNELHGSGQQGASVRANPDAKWAPLLAT
jgi:hypothetical protein